MQITLPQQVGNEVRRKRREIGLTQRKLAKQSGVSERTIISLEQGQATGIRIDKLISVLDQLELSLFIEETTAANIKKARADALRAQEKSISRPRSEYAVQ